jgi:hypothetical protein
MSEFKNQFKKILKEETRYPISDTIIKQMGGFNRIKSMTGCDAITTDKYSIHIVNFKGSKKYNQCIVTYIPKHDLYDMKIYRFDANSIQKGERNVENFEQLFFDQLVDMFEETTGIKLSL